MHLQLPGEQLGLPRSRGRDTMDFLAHNKIVEASCHAMMEHHREARLNDAMNLMHPMMQKNCTGRCIFESKTPYEGSSTTMGERLTWNRKISDKGYRSAWQLPGDTRPS